MSLQGTNQWRHKMRAIGQVGKLFASTIKPTSDMTGVIFVPVPPSKIETDPEYDPRIVQALQKASEISGVNLPTCQCITQQENTEPDHRSGATRLTPSERAASYNVHLDRIPQNTRLAVIVDDVLTTGSHFKGIEMALKNYLPQIQVNGLFVARTIHTNPFDDFDNLDLSKILNQ